jgi:ABC-type antimicrobial peptide transport system permease subunit
MAATTTLTLGLVLHGVTSQPYEGTRKATNGPDIVAAVFPTRPSSGPPADLLALTHASGVVGHSGPYPVTLPVLRVHGRVDAVIAVGRDQAVTPIDQPKLTQGSWIRGDGVVVERSFADALGIHVGDAVTLNGRSFQVAGIAVTAAIPPYPDAGFFQSSQEYQNPGLVWLTRSSAESLSTHAEPVGYMLNLKLAHPAGADAFENQYDINASSTAPYLMSWQDISQQDAKLVQNEQKVLLIGSWMLGLLAVASVAVLVGGRIAEQTRRVGLLKAVGGTPGLIAAVLLAEYLVVAMVAAVAGLAVGRLVAPMLTSPGAGLVGSAGAPPISMGTVEFVVAVALAVAVVATLVPTIRAARTSTVRALAGSTRPPKRRPRLIALSARLPVALLLGLRLAARRPRRMVLSAVSIAITVSTIVTVLTAQAWLDAHQLHTSSGLEDPQDTRLRQVMLIITVVLVILAAINITFITWSTVIDSRRQLAVTRALGATPGQVSAALSTAQLLPAVVGVILGIPGGIGLYAAVSNNSGSTVTPPVSWLIAVVLGSLIVVGGLTAIPARIAARRPVAPVLQSELA